MPSLLRAARGVLVAAILAALFSGCAVAVGGRQFDRCHRGETQRQTLYFELLCVETP